MNSTSEQLFDVFLSHAHLDAEIVEMLGQRLEDEAGFRIWLDRWILIPGKHWQQEMAKGLDQAKTCAVCIGQSTPKGWFHEEIQRALNRQTKEESFRVIPVILPRGNQEFVDDFLELRTWVDFKNSISDRIAFHLLTCGIKGVPPGRLPKADSKEETTSDERLSVIRQKLLRIKSLQLETLIDNEIALEYQRRLLDRLLDFEG